jgi:hypothetical protein
MNNLQDAYRRSIDKEKIERVKQAQIKVLLWQLTECKAQLKILRNTDVVNMSKVELSRHERELNLQNKRKSGFIKTLDSLGYKADRRGRPKKVEGEKYKVTHTRMTCYFTEANSKHLKELKDQKEIDNISGFLNNLLDYYFSSDMDGTCDEGEN